MFIYHHILHIIKWIYALHSCIIIISRNIINCVHAIYIHSKIEEISSLILVIIADTTAGVDIKTTDAAACQFMW